MLSAYYSIVNPLYPRTNPVVSPFFPRSHTGLVQGYNGHTMEKDRNYLSASRALPAGFIGYA